MRYDGVIQLKKNSDANDGSGDNQKKEEKEKDQFVEALGVKK